MQRHVRIRPTATQGRCADARTPDQLPLLTHHECLFLALLAAGIRDARDLRPNLYAAGCAPCAGTTNLASMAERLRRRDLLSIGDDIEDRRHRVYTILDLGRETLRVSLEYYRALARLARLGE